MLSKSTPYVKNSDIAKRASPHRPRLRRTRAGPSRVIARADVGEQIPNATVSYFNDADDLKETPIHDLFRSKKVVLFGVPGAFLPTCSMKHLPEYIQGASKLREKGVDLIACISVNDAFVMDAWGKSLGAADDIMMLADGSASFAKAMGSDMDLSARNVGTRSRRYSCIIDDLTVQSLFMEDGGAFTVSGVDNILASL